MSDDAAVMKSLQASLPTISQNCMAHGFHLAMKDAFDLIGENNICYTEDGINSENEEES